MSRLTILSRALAKAERTQAPVEIRLNGRIVQVKPNGIASPT